MAVCTYEGPGFLSKGNFTCFFPPCFLIVHALHAPTLAFIAYPAYLVLAKIGCVTLRRRRAKQRKQRGK